MGDFDKKGTSKPSAFNGLEIPRVYILFKEEGIMKKQWLSIVLVLCMVLCMAPATALCTGKDAPKRSKENGYAEDYRGYKWGV